MLFKVSLPQPSLGRTYKICHKISSCRAKKNEVVQLKVVTKAEKDCRNNNSTLKLL